MYWYPTQPYNVPQGGPQGNGELQNLYREIESQRMLSRQILSLVRENHRLLSLLYSKQYGSYPTQWNHELINS